MAGKDKTNEAPAMSEDVAAVPFKEVQDDMIANPDNYVVKQPIFVSDGVYKYE